MTSTETRSTAPPRRSAFDQPPRTWARLSRRAWRIRASTRSPCSKGRSSRMGAASISTISWAGASAVRVRPGSPWMPMPISISSSASSNDGEPTCGTVHDVSAKPIDRTEAITRPASATHAARSSPRSAAAPTLFSSSTVPPTPRRPAVYSESFTATSSSITTLRTSDSASSPAVSKFSTSPV